MCNATVSKLLTTSTDASEKTTGTSSLYGTLQHLKSKIRTDTDLASRTFCVLPWLEFSLVSCNQFDLPLILRVTAKGENEMFRRRIVRPGNLPILRFS